MKRQKVCIIGGGLTGLATALTLSQLNLDIDLVSADSINNSTKSVRTTAISHSNYEFLRRIINNKFFNKNFWPCNKMKLYTEDKNKKINEIFKIDKNKTKQEKIFYTIDNKILTKLFIKSIKKEKRINIKFGKKITDIGDSGLLKSIRFGKGSSLKYNLIIICTGSFSNFVKKIFKEESLQRSYNELSITTILKHSSLQNNTARQIFLDGEIFALLPISKVKTSIVWSVKENKINKNVANNNLFIKNKIKFYTKDFLKKVNFINNMEYKNLNLYIRKKYFQERLLLLGEALHQVHPLAGQGFNMVLRDLSSFEKILKTKINLGLDIGSLDILSEFSKKTKPRNFVYSLGIDFIRNFFHIENKSFKHLRDKTIKKLNQNSFTKNIFYNIADRGIKL